MATIGVAAAGPQPAAALDAGDGGAQDRRPPRRSTPGSRPTRRRGGGCSPATMPRPTPPGSTSPGSPATRSTSTASNGSPRRPTGAGDGLAAAATATTPPGRSWRSIRASARSCAGELRLCRLQGRLGAGRAQPHLAGPQPRRRLARRHRQLEQSGRAARRAALHRPDGARASSSSARTLTGFLPPLA